MAGEKKAKNFKQKITRAWPAYRKLHFFWHRLRAPVFAHFFHFLLLFLVDFLTTFLSHFFYSHLEYTRYLVEMKLVLMCTHLN